jgi:pimeloyl-ACP methyl ester carboxylesterase
MTQATTSPRAVQIPDRSALLGADLRVPADPAGLVIFAHGSGSSRRSARNRQVAEMLDDAGLATLLLDLLTPAEESIDQFTREFRFDIPRLGRRVVAAADWAGEQPDLRRLPLGFFGASTGAAAAIIAAAERPNRAAALVSRGGRPDLAGDALGRLQSPTLLIVGGDDEPVIEMNEDAQRQMRAVTRLEIVPGATHLFEEPGTLDQVARLAIGWFRQHLRPRTTGHDTGTPDGASQGPRAQGGSYVQESPGLR